MPRPGAPTEPHTGSAADPISAGQSIDRFLARHEVLVLLSVVAVVALRAIIDSRQKPLWYDEVFTVFTAAQPTMTRFFGSLPANGIGPLYPLCVRALLPLFGHGDLVVRLPSLVAFCAALVGVYLFVRRDCGPLFGLAAVVLTIAEPGWAYSFEARPYAMLLAFMMLGLVSWQSAARALDRDDRNLSRLWPLAGVALAFAGSIFSHHIGVIELGLPLLAGEAVRSWRRRRLDWPLLSVAAASALASLAITLPMAIKVRRLLLEYPMAAQASMDWRQAIRTDLANAKLSFWVILNGEVIWACIVMVLVAWGLCHWWGGTPANTAPGGASNTVRPEFIAAALGAALLIPVTMVFMESLTGFYNCRYGIGSMLGVGLLAIFLAWRRDRTTTPVLLVVSLLFAGPWLRIFAGELHHRELPPKDVAYKDTSTLPVVVSDPFRFVPVWWYAPEEFRQRMVYLRDPHGNAVIELGIDGEAPFVGLPLDNLDHFVASHDHFLVMFGVPRTPLLQDQLTHAGFAIAPIQDSQYSDVQRKPARLP